MEKKPGAEKGKIYRIGKKTARNREERTRNGNWEQEQINGEIGR